MKPVRYVRHFLWWPIIPVGWVLVGVAHIHGLWVVMVVLTMLAAGVFGGCGRRQRHDEHNAEYPEPHWAGRDRGHPRHQRYPTEVLVPEAASDPAHGASLAQLAQDQRLPVDVRTKAQLLDRECGDTLRYLQERGADAGEVVQVEQIAQDFGPETVRSFLALSPQTVDTQVLADGKTGHQLVLAHLDLLTAAVRDRMHAAARLGNEPLLSHHRFLTDKFGQAERDDGLLL